MQTINRNGWIFQILDSGVAVLTECQQGTPQLVLPSEIDGHPLTAVEHDAFDHTGPVEAFRVAADHPAFSVVDGVLFDRAGERLIRYPRRRYAEEYRVPDTVRTVGTGAFAGTELLRRAVVPEGVSAIETLAFSDCPALAEVSLPASTVGIGHELFRGCLRLREVSIPASHPFLRVEGGFLVDRKESMLLACLPGREDKELDAPQDIRFVDEYAFYRCNELQKIHFHHGLRTLGGYAFYHCRSLKTVDLPDNLRTIGARAFSGCGQLRTLYVPDSVTSIGYKAFNNCNKLTLLVNKGSYTDRYCRQFGFPCRHKVQWPWQ